MKKVVLNPYLWILIIYLVSMFTLADGIYHLFYYIGVHLNSGDYHSYEAFEKSEIKLHDYASLTAEFIYFIAIVLLVFKTSLFTSRKVDIRKKDFLNALYCFLIKIGVTIVTGIILFYLGLENETNSVSGNQDNLEDLVSNSFIIGAIFIVLLAPIIEEFIFRKLLMGHIFKNYKYTGWIISSILFGSLHLLSGFSILGLVIYMSLGFILGWIYMKTKRIEASIIAHLFNNLVSIAMMGTLL